MAVIGIDVRSREPYEFGVAFGDAGAYEQIDGVVRFAVDPAHAANEVIVDLDKLGISVAAECERLLEAGVAAFAGSQDSLFQILAERRAALLGASSLRAVGQRSNASK